MHQPPLTFYIVGEIARRQSLQGAKCPAFYRSNLNTLLPGPRIGRGTEMVLVRSGDMVEI